MTVWTGLGLLFGGLLHYALVLRRFNSLGLRIFSITTAISVAGLWLILRDHAEFRRVDAAGVTVTATVVSKHQRGDTRSVTVRWQERDWTLEAYLSAPEWSAMSTGQTVPLIHVPGAALPLLQASYLRMRRQYWIIETLCAALFLSGAAAGWWLRAYRIGVDSAGDEWLENPEGRVIADERGNALARGAKRLNLAAKLWQWLSR